MDHPGLDPNTALQLIQAVLYWIAYVLGGAMLLGLSAYIVFLCSEVFSPQPGSKGPLAKVPQPVGCAAVAEENLDLIAAETPILAEAESFDREAVQMPALPDDAPMPITLLPVTLASEPTGPWGFLNFLRSRRAAVPQKRGSSLIANAQFEKLA